MRGSARDGHGARIAGLPSNQREVAYHAVPVYRRPLTHCLCYVCELPRRMLAGHRRIGERCQRTVLLRTAQHPYERRHSARSVWCPRVPRLRGWRATAPTQPSDGAVGDWTGQCLPLERPRPTPVRTVFGHACLSHAGRPSRRRAAAVNSALRTHASCRRAAVNCTLRTRTSCRLDGGTQCVHVPSVLSCDRVIVYNGIHTSW